MLALSTKISTSISITTSIANPLSLEVYMCRKRPMESITAVLGISISIGIAISVSFSVAISIAKAHLERNSFRFRA